MPLNLCNAFLDPVSARSGNRLGIASAGAMLDHLKRMRAMVPVDEATYFMAHALPDAPGPADGVTVLDGYRSLVEKVMEELQK